MRLPQIPATVLVIVILVTSRSGPVVADDGSRQYQVARGLYARAQWDAAAEELEDFLQNHPNHLEAAQAQFYLGEALVQQRRYQEAVPRFETYLNAQPDGAFRKQALFRLAECGFFGDLPTAGGQLAGFSEAFPDDRLNGLVLNYRGQIALREGKPDQAEVLFRQAVDRFPDRISQDQSRLGLARALEALKKPEEAERYFLALAAKPNSPVAIEARYRLGSLQYAERNYASALETFMELDSVPASNPWVASAGLGKGWTLMKLDRLQDAAQTFARLVDNPVVAVQARYWLGLCRKAEKDWQGAKKMFVAAAEKLEEEEKTSGAARSAGDVTKTAILFHAGDAQLAAGNLTEARDSLDHAVASARKGDQWLDDARRAAVQTSLRLKDYARARTDAERFLGDRRENPATCDLLRLLVRTQLEQQDFEAAERTLRELAKVNRDGDSSAEDAYLLALTYQGQRRFDAALRALQPALEDPTGKLASDARLVEGSLLVAMKRYDEAQSGLSEHLSEFEAEADRRQALALLAVCHARLGRGEESQRLYEETFAKGAESTSLHWDTAEQIAAAALDAKQYDRAESLYRELIDSDAEEARKRRAMVGLAWVQHDRSDDASAEATLARLLDGRADSEVPAEALFLRGRVLRELGQLEPARQAFEQVIRNHGESAYARDALWEAAQLDERLGRPDQAARLYQTILDLSPPHNRRAGALYNLAWIHQEEGKSDEAAALFRKIVDEYQNSPYRAHAILAVAQHDFDSGRRAEAAAILNELLKDGDKASVRDRALYLAGQIAFADHHWQQARQRFEQVVSECPDSDLRPTAAVAACEAAFQAGDADAAPRFERFLGETSDVPEPLRATAQMRLAQLYAEAGRWEDAAAIAEPFAERHPGFTQQYELDYIRGRCLAARALFAEARQAYEKAIQDPAGEHTETAAKAQLMIAETYFHQRDYAEAFRAYMQVEILYAYPELQAAALLQAGKCRQLQGNSAAALDLYRQVLKNYPKTEAAGQAALQLGAEADQRSSGTQESSESGSNMP
ncbi:MAG: tetratricopeptide repeat protein [Planctomycetaceae bacterium]|nr:tetratricopeptide repeat protein [Planctomycetaceae bacterium]